MKNKKIWLVLLVIVLAFGMTACPNPTDSNSNSGGNTPLTVDSTNGKLTVSNLGSYNDEWIVAIGGNEAVSIYAAGSIGTDFTFTGALISSGSATLKVWKATSTNHLSNYNGTDVLGLYAAILTHATLNASEYNQLLAFLQGAAKPSFVENACVINSVSFTNGTGSTAAPDYPYP